MKKQAELFNDFPPIDKATWLDKVEQDLKGRPLEDLQWHLNEQITLEPFYHPEDLPEQYRAIRGDRNDNDWEIGEYIDVHEPKQANQQLIEGLNGGTQAPLLRLYHPATAEELSVLLAGVAPNMVSLNFGEYYANKQPGQLFSLFTGWLTSQSADPQQTTGSIDFDPLLDWSEPPIADLAEMIRTCQKHWPGIRPLQVNARTFHGGAEKTVTELAMTVAKGSEYLHRLQEAGLPPDVANQHLQFGIAISKSYFVEIAKLRALRLLWANVMKGYGAERRSAFLSVHFARETQDEHINTNIIRAGTQAMSAVIGGCDRLYVLPADHIKQEGYASSHLRIARNLQHLLKMESHLHQVVDPGAGSYYIEKLTDKLAEAAWEAFQQLERERAFA